MLSKIFLGVGVFAALFAVLIFSGKLPIGQQKVTAAGEVVMWGTLPETGMNPIIQQFNPQAKTYRVTYVQVREDQFNQKLLEALANQNGPDLILAPYQQILAQAPRITSFPVASYGEKLFKDTFVDGASVLFNNQTGAIALPVSVEPMVLFYNRTLFSRHGIVNPPKYWDEVTTMTPNLTVMNNGRFAESAIALGAHNTPYAKDILMSIVQQLGQVPVTTQYTQLGEPYLSVVANQPIDERPDVYPLASAVRYFTQFADPQQTSYTWNQYAGNADDQFVAEKLAMYIGYSGELQTLRARNPRAEFEMTYLPQTRGYESNFATGMRMYALATLKTSKNPTAALTVEAQFAGSGIAPSIAAIVGGVPALRSYAATTGLHEVVARSMLVARGWYDNHYVQSSSYTVAMLADVLGYRYGINDAVGIFIGRLRDLYTSPY